MSSDLAELRGAVRLMADNYSPDQPRDQEGRFAGGGAIHKHVRDELLGHKDGKEHSILTDREGKVLGRTFGEEEQVNTPDHPDLKRAGAGLVAHHNHPFDSGPSMPDVLHLADKAGLGEIQIHSDEASYRVKVLTEDRRALYNGTRDAFDKAHEKELDRILELPKAKDDAERKARREESYRRESDIAMKILAKKALIEYERVPAAEISANFNPNQPRDARGRFASTGGGKVALPIGISKDQRAQLTPEERAQWNKTWHEHDKAKKAAKAEKDPARALQQTLKAEALLAKLKDIRAGADARLKGGGTVEKKHGKDDKKQEKEVEDHAKKGGGAKKDDQTGKQKGEKGHIDHEAEAQKMVSALKDLATGSGVDLIHLGALRGEMRHLSKEQFDQVMQHARRQGTITLTGAERGSGAPEFDKKHAIYEKDPVTGRNDTMLIYASLRGGQAAGAGGTTTKTSDPPARDIHQALDMAHLDSKAAFGKYAISGQLQPGNSIHDRLNALGGADTVAFDHLLTDPHLSQKVKNAGIPFLHNEYFRTVANIHREWERANAQYHDPSDAKHSVESLDKIEKRIKEEAVPALKAVGQQKMADFYEKHAPVVIEQLRRHFRGEDKGPKVLTRQSLTERLLNAPSAAGPAHSLSTVAKHAVQADEMLKIMDEHSTLVGMLKRHGMSFSEEMHGMLIEGTHFQWSHDTKNRASYAIAQIVQAGTHQKLWDANKTVVLSAQKNKEDSYWEVAYKEPGFTSAATGGDGHVVGYQIDKFGMTVGTFHHESGHNFAFKVWGNTSPLVYGPTYEGKASDGYARAQKKEKPVTTYGAKSPAEDFAEAVRLYAGSPQQKAGLERDFPLKHKAIEDLLGVPPAPVS